MSTEEVLCFFSVSAFHTSFHRKQTQTQKGQKWEIESCIEAFKKQILMFKRRNPGDDVKSCEFLYWFKVCFISSGEVKAYQVSCQSLFAPGKQYLSEVTCAPLDLEPVHYWRRYRTFVYGALAPSRALAKSAAPAQQGLFNGVCLSLSSRQPFPRTF